MANITQLFDTETPDDALESLKGHYSEFMICGWDEDGYLSIRTTEGMTPPEMLWLMENTKREIFTEVEAVDEDDI